MVYYSTQWSTTIHHESKTLILTSGNTLTHVIIDSGVHQGCPWAPLLFTCATEPLACTMRKYSIAGIPLSTQYSINYNGYTILSNVIIALPTCQSSLRFSLFLSTYSGLKVNTHKLLLMPLGSAVIELALPLHMAGFFFSQALPWGQYITLP
jgi:hypothetical protein